MAPKFVRPSVREMEGYTPGEQPGPGERIVKLNTNENPFQPSPKVMQAIREIEPEMLRRYPNPGGDQFREAAAKVLERDAGHDPHRQRQRRRHRRRTADFLRPGDVLAYPEPTYSLYPVLAEIDEVKVATVRWENDWSLADRSTARDQGEGDLPRQSQRPQRHVRPAGQDRGAGEQVQRRDRR